MLNFIILKVHWTLNVSNERLVFTVNVCTTTVIRVGVTGIVVVQCTTCVCMRVCVPRKACPR